MSLIAVTAICGLLAGTSSAAVLIPGGSSFTVNLAALPTITIPGAYSTAGGAGATLTNNVGGGHDISSSAGLFQGTGITAGTSLMTGVALLVNMTLNASNNAATYTSNFASGVLSNNDIGGGLTAGNSNFSAGSDTLCATGCLGAGGTPTAGRFSGSIVLQTALGGVPFPLGAIGGGTSTVIIGSGAIVATGAPWVTGKVQVTGITTNVISVPGRPGGAGPGGGQTGVGVTMNLTTMEGQTAKVISVGGGFLSTGTTAALPLERNTVAFSGTNNLSSSAVGGNVTMISPTRVDTGILGQGTIPGVFRQKFKFVPEPGTVLLLVSGAAGLVALGRKRMKN